MNSKIIANNKAKKNLQYAKKISAFISTWQKNNPYKKEKLKEYNSKFRTDFMAFCKKAKIPAKEMKGYLNL